VIDDRHTTNHQPIPNRQRNTRADSARTPARPSVIEVTHKAVGNMINSVDASAKPPPAHWHQE
jgi:hypothetical protein